MPKPKRTATSRSAARKQPRASELQGHAPPPSSSSPSSSPFGKNDDSQRLWKVRSILQETTNLFRIDWEDDEVTGQRFEPTWEPKSHANREAVQDWKRKQATRRRRAINQNTFSPAKRAGKDRSISGSAKRSDPNTPTRRPSKRRRIVESSSQSNRYSQLSASTPSQVDAAIQDSELDLAESKQATGPRRDISTFAAADSPASTVKRKRAARIRVSQPPSSYDAGAYEVYLKSQATVHEGHTKRISPATSPEPSQFIPTQLGSAGTTKDTTTDNTLHTATTSTAEHTYPDTDSARQLANSVVPESQEQSGSASFVPTAAENTRQRSSVEDPQRSLASPAESQDDQGPDTGQFSSGSQRIVLDSTRKPGSSGEVLRESLAETVTSHASPARAYSGGGTLQFPQSSPYLKRQWPKRLSLQTVLTQGPEPNGFVRSTAPVDQIGKHNTEVVVGTAAPQASQQRPYSQLPISLVVDSSPNNGSAKPRSQPNQRSDRFLTSHREGSFERPHHTQLSHAPAQSQPYGNRSIATQWGSQQNPGAVQSREAVTTDTQRSSFPFATQIRRRLSIANIVNPVDEDPRKKHLPPLAVASPERPRDTAQALPAAAYSSSPAPSVPSRSISQTIGESAPHRPATPSSPLPHLGSGDKYYRPSSQTRPKQAGKYFAAKLGPLRDRTASTRAGSRVLRLSRPSSAAGQSPSPTAMSPGDSQNIPSIAHIFASSYVAAEARARSPSAVPAEEPLPVITQEEMNTSERFETLLPQAQDAEVNEKQSAGPATATGTPKQRAQIPDSDETSFRLIPIILVGHQRDQYLQTVYHHRDLIQRVLEASEPDERLLAETESFVDTMRRIVIHPDLINDETQSQYDVSPSQQAQWDIDCSAKFRFLGYLVDSTKNQNIHIVVMAGSGRIMDILGTFMQGKKVNYQRSGERESSQWAKDAIGVRVTLASSLDEIGELGTSDLVVAMDHSVFPDANAVRQCKLRLGHHRSFLTLVVPRSVEHIQLSLSNTLSKSERTKALLRGIQQFKDDAGKRRPQQLNPEDTALSLAEHWTNPASGDQWPLTDLEPIRELDSQTETESDPQLNTLEVPRTTSAVEKRGREEDEVEIPATDLTKKARLGGADAPLTVDPQKIELALYENPDSQESAVQSADAAIDQRVQDALAAAGAKVAEHVEALSDLQYRYEDQRAALLETTQQRDAAIGTAQQATERFTEQLNQMSALRTERTALKQMLEVANSKLADHSNPERAEFEQLRLALDQVKLEKEQMGVKLEAANKRFEYLSEQYQLRSSEGETLSRNCKELEKQLLAAETKASGEQARLRQMGFDARATILQEENRRLRAVVRDREAALKVRDDEISRLKEASRGRMGTRGTSVPRSPRMGSPMKRDGSRQTSPPAGGGGGGGGGELRVKAAQGSLHPLRH